MTTLCGECGTEYASLLHHLRWSPCCAPADAADVGGDGVGYSTFTQTGIVKQTASQKQIGRRAEYRVGAGFGDGVAHVLRDVVPPTRHVTCSRRVSAASLSSQNWRWRHDDDDDDQHQAWDEQSTKIRRRIQTTGFTGTCSDANDNNLKDWRRHLAGVGSDDRGGGQRVQQ